MSEKGAKINELKQSIAQKRERVREVVQHFSDMHQELSSVQHGLAQERQGNKPLLADLKDESEDSRLSHMFAEQSQAMRHEQRKDTKAPMKLGHLKKHD